MNTTKYQSRTRKQIENHLQSQRQSGLSVINYCKKHGILKQTFYTWRTRYKSPLVADKTKNDFVALKIEPSIIEEPDTAIAQINHPNGCSISFYKSCTPSFLSQTIKQL